jgi:hypothetical protein
MKLFDFFPMDNWIEMIAGTALKLLPGYLEKARDMFPEIVGGQGEFRTLLWEYYIKHTEVGHHLNVQKKVAREFVERYKDEVLENNSKIFRKLTTVISDAEIRGYNNLNNNCQTIVSEIV